ncbi:MAG: hypothetical protein JNL53_05575 [Cyclobacteriaceae bacterium]|nr:hypothetical protein [Cyclobacteriaceae bacterium]
MKKYLTFAILVLVSFDILAQEDAVSNTTETIVLKSKKGIPILPEAGEWGLGISANPFLNYGGNFFNGNTNNNSPSFAFPTNPTNNIALFGKYVVDAHTAYRVRFNATVNTTVDKAVIAQNEITPDPFFPAFTEDFRKTNRQTVVVAAGYEKRRGKSRVQGVYGGELVIGYTGINQSYEYGNPMSQDFNAPITNNFGGNILQGSSAAAVQRKIDEKFGSILTVGARGFIGVEYFIGPKVSLGGEFGYSLAFNNSTRGLITSERWNPSTNSVLETKTDINNNGYFTFVGTSLDNLSGSINLLFYF